MIVEDDDRVRDMLEKYLSSEGFRAVAVASGKEFQEQFSHEEFDLILLDIGLPGEDGLSLARELRNGSDVGIIMLTGRKDVVDRVVGIEIGADDYITKPFHLREVLARVKAVLRRTRGSRNGMDRRDAGMEAGTVMSFGRWQLMVDQRRLLDADGYEVSFTAGEFDLLVTLVRNAGRVLTRDQLIDMTKGPGWIALDRTVDAQIARLRKKIEPDTKHPLFIKSVRGVGYMFAAKVHRSTR